MHFLLIAIAPRDVDAIKHVARNLAYYVDYSEHGFSNPDGNRGYTHDRWQTGGRWTGWLTGYNPVKDPANLEPCPNRYQGHPKDCARCNETGLSLKSPLLWKRYDGDVGTVDKALANEYLPYALLTEDGVWIDLQERLGEHIIDHSADMRAAIEARRDLQAVVVDCHR
jgi:hypothetical protein